MFPPEPDVTATRSAPRPRLAAAALATLAALTLTLGAVTWIALEGNEVVTLHTLAPGGSPHATSVWIADAEGAAWVEAATPERPFVRDILANPRVEVERDGGRRTLTAEVVPNPEGHERVRELLRARYGPADAWIGLLQDTSRSIAIRLHP
jgi:hypothetical protein